MMWLILGLCVLLQSTTATASAEATLIMVNHLLRMTRPIVEYEHNGRRTLDLFTVEDAIRDNKKAARKKAEELGVEAGAAEALTIAVNTIFSRFITAKDTKDTYQKWREDFVKKEDSFLKTKCGSMAEQYLVIHLFGERLQLDYASVFYSA